MTTAQQATNRLVKRKKSNAFLIAEYNNGDYFNNYYLFTITVVEAVSLLFPALSLATNFNNIVSGS